jgi:hypothetical protein
VDRRANTYGLGCISYYVLAGRSLSPEGTFAQKLIWHHTRQPAPLRSLRPDVPAELDAIINRMLAKSVAARFQTAADVARALEALPDWRDELPAVDGPGDWPPWVTALAEALAAGERCHAVLACALEEAGHAELAEHFRPSGRWHLKTCWALRRILRRP